MMAAPDSPGQTGPERFAQLDWQRTHHVGRDVLVLRVLAPIEAHDAGLLRSWARHGLVELDGVPPALGHCPALLIDLSAVPRVGADAITALIDAVRSHCGDPAATGAAGEAAVTEPLRLLVDRDLPAVWARDVRGLGHLLGLYHDRDAACGTVH